MESTQRRGPEVQNNLPIENRQWNRPSSWALQLSKCVILAASSVGLGWLIGRLWGSNEVENSQHTGNEQRLAIVHRTGKRKYSSFTDPMTPFDRGESLKFATNQQSLFQRIGIAYSSQQTSDRLSCAIGLSIGSVESALSANPFPLLMGSILCIPTTHAESTIPDSVFDYQRQHDNSIQRAKKNWHSLTVLLGAAIGFGAGGVGACVGALAGDQLGFLSDDLIEKYFADDYLGRILRHEMYKWQNKIAQNPDLQMDPIKVLMGGTTQILNELADPRYVHTEHNLLLIKEFITYTQKIFEEQYKINEGLVNTLDLNREESALFKEESALFKENILNLNLRWDKASQEMNKVITELTGVQTDVQAHSEKFKQLEGSTKESFKQVYSQIKSLRLDQKQMGTLTKLLVEQSIAISTKGFESSKTIMTLEKELRELQSNGDLSGSMKKGVELKKAIQAEEVKRVKFDQTLQGIGNGFHLLSLTAAAGGNSKLAHQISTIGQSALTIAHSIGTLAGFGTAAMSLASGLTVLGPIGAIAGAVFAITQLWKSSGPSPDEQILKAVQELAKNLHQVRKEMHERFDHVEEIIIKHHQYTGMRFDRLEQMLEIIHTNFHRRLDDLLDATMNLHKATIYQFLSVKDDAEAIRNMLGSFGKILKDIESKIDDKFRELYKEKYTELKANAFNHRRLISEPMEAKEWNNYFLKFYDWASRGVLNSLVTKTHSGKVTASAVARTVAAEGVDYSVQSLVDLAHANFNFNYIATLPNPSLWAEAVDTFLEFLWQTPELKLEPNKKDAIEDLLAVGSSYQQFVAKLQTSPEVFQQLLKNYQADITRLQEVFETLITEVITNKQMPVSWQSQLQNVSSNGLNNTSVQLFETFANLSIQRKKFSEHMASSVTQIEGTKSSIAKLASSNDGMQAPWNKVNGYFDEQAHNEAKSADVWSRQHGKTGGKEEKFTTITSFLQSVNNLNSLVKNAKGQFDLTDGKHKELQNDHTSLEKSLSESAVHLEKMHSAIQKAAEIHNSQERVYFLAQRISELLSQILPNRQFEQNQLYDMAKKLSEGDDFYLYLLHHLTTEDRKALKTSLKNELAKHGSPLNLVLDAIHEQHVLLEAYIRLAFPFEFENDYHFRKRFENVWSANSVRSTLLNWNETKPEEIPYIQLQDKALPFLQQLQTAIFDAISEWTLARSEETETSRKKSGHAPVDGAMHALRSFKLIFFPHTETTDSADNSHDEL